MGFLRQEELRRVVEQIVRAALPFDELAAGVYGRAPGLVPASGTENERIWKLIQALNEHVASEWLYNWLLDVHQSLRFRGWPDAGLSELERLVVNVRRAGPRSSLAKEEERFQEVLREQHSRAEAEQRRVNDRRAGGTKADRDRVDAWLRRIEKEQQRGRPLEEGDVLSGRFELLTACGHGGFSRVWQAFDRGNRHEVVAVKVLRGELRGDDSARERFFAGAAALARAARGDPGFVPVLVERAQDGPYHYFVMEYMSGGTLEAHLGDVRRAEAALLAVCDAVGRLHARGALHLDIKPTNILFDDADQPRLTDFELFQRVDDPLATHQARPHVSPLYSAPEVQAGREARRESDVYSLGRVALAVALGGVRLDDASASKRLRAALVAALNRATDPDPGARFADATSFRAALQEAYADSGDLERWLRDVSLPAELILAGFKARQFVFEVLKTVRDASQLGRLLELLGVERSWINEESPLDEAAFEVASRMTTPLQLLHFWHRLAVLRDGAIFRHAGESAAAADPSELLRARLLVDVSLDQLRFLAMCTLPFQATASLPSVFLSSRETAVAATLQVLGRHGATGEFLTRLASVSPNVAARLREGGVEITATPPPMSSLWGAWSEIPAVEPRRFLRAKLPAAAWGLIAPAWSDERVRREGAMLLVQHGLVEPRPRIEPDGDTPRDFLRALLVVMYGDVELRLLVMRAGHAVEIWVPGQGADRRELGAGLGDRVVMLGMLDEFLALLLRQRPAWRAEILDVAARFDLTGEALLVAPPPMDARWRLGILMLMAFPDGDMPLASLEIPTASVGGPETAPRLRAVQAATSAMRQGLVDAVFFDRLVERAPHVASQAAALWASLRELGPAGYGDVIDGPAWPDEV